MLNIGFQLHNVLQKIISYTNLKCIPQMMLNTVNKSLQKPTENKKLAQNIILKVGFLYTFFAQANICARRFIYPRIHNVASLWTLFVWSTLYYVLGVSHSMTIEFSDFVVCVGSTNNTTRLTILIQITVCFNFNNNTYFKYYY